jgi:hypothetical protein
MNFMIDLDEPRVHEICEIASQARIGHLNLHWYSRAKALAAALQSDGIRPGDRVGTLMWNHYPQSRIYVTNAMTESRCYRIVTSFCEIFQFNQGAVPKG